MTDPATTVVETAGKGASLYSNVVNAGSNAGRALAEKGMGEDSKGLANALGKIKETYKGDDLGDCRQKAAISLITKRTIDTDVCKPDALEVGKDVGGGLISKAFLKAVGSVPGQLFMQLFDAGSAALDTMNNHKDSIRLLAQQNFPGMSYKETFIDGRKVTIWSDALDAGTNASDPKIKTYIEVDGAADPESVSKFQQDNYRQLAALENEGVAKALESVQSYVAANGTDALKTKITEGPAALADAYEVEHQAMLAYRKSIQQQGPAVATAAASP